MISKVQAGLARSESEGQRRMRKLHDGGGMLKAFFDRYGSNGLAGVVAVPVMTGGWPGHLLAVGVHPRPVLVELAATVRSRGLYVTEPWVADLDTAVAKWSATATPLITTALPSAPRNPAG
jgi:FMN reductase